jgi:putative addiction module component (TIGR02574 family)
MSESMKSLGIDHLSASERLVLLEEISDSLAATPESVPLTEAQKVELDRRLATSEADPAAGSTWQEVKARIWGPS